MTIKFNYLNSKTIKNIKNYALFSDDNFKILKFKSLGLSNQNFINDLIENNKDKNKNIIHINLNKQQNLIVIKLKENQSSLDNEKLGAEFYDFVNSNSVDNLTFIDENFLEKSLNQMFIEEFFHGIELKSYQFKKYKSKKDFKVIKINIISKGKKQNLDNSNRFKSLLSGINFTKDLVSEPGNILHPDEYAKRLKSLSKASGPILVK